MQVGKLMKLTTSSDTHSPTTRNTEENDLLNNERHALLRQEG